MFDNNDQQNQQTASPAGQPTGIQNTTTPDIADPNLTSANPSTDTTAGAPSAPMPQEPSATITPGAATTTDPVSTTDQASSSPMSTPTPEPTLNTSAPADTANPDSASLTSEDKASSNTTPGADLPDLSAPSATSKDTPSSSSTTGSDDLLSIKKGALENLTPLLDHLDQSPEEKFRTTMMLIQASDDQSLVQSAYKAAQQISDEKEKAQALLDIVNEINYFTHNDKKDQEPKIS
jgi:hypothetical protein